MKEGVIAMTKSERRVYQLALEVVRQKLSMQNVIRLFCPGDSDL